MNQHLQTILNYIQQSEHLSDEEKTSLSKAAKDAIKDFEITSFKLDRTEKVKRTTAILLEETIEELEQKRKAVEAQNRELEVESALERVRTIAMSMNKPDDMLDVCKTISQQLELLNVKEIRNVQTAIFYPEKSTYMNYEYYAKHDKRFITETSYTNSEMHLAFAEQMLKGNGEVFTSHINGNDIKEWIAYQKTTNVFIDDFLYDATSLNYYWFSLGSVALGISTYQPLKEEDKILFKRFLKVFELAYRRYLDIEKAEAQAKEARIEAALEKVRSRSLAVHKSDEFNEVVTIVFEKLQELDIVASSVSINIFIEGSKDTEVYICGPNESGLVVSHFLLFYFDNPISNDRFNAQESGLDFFTKTYGLEEKNSFYEYEFEVSGLKNLPADIKKMVFESKRYTISLALAKHSMIVVNDFEGKTLSEKEIDIVKRFSRVFEQAYIRFLDLQKAEAQTRESQIQLALERARAQSMMMQHSTELDDTLRVFHEQVLLLSIPSAFSFLWLPDEDKDQHIFWAAWAENNLFKSKAMNYPLNRNEPATAQCLIDWKGNEPVVSYHVSSEDVENYFAAWNELIAGVEQLKPEYFSDGLYYVEAFMKYGCFGVMVKNTLHEDEKEILERFAVEFERTYTRFLDLQKAEAQAREAQIETSLERIRARTMGMQKSNELQEIVALLYEECNRFEFRSLLINIKTRNEQDNGFNWWMSFNERNVLPQPYFIPDIDEPVLEEIKSLWHSEKPYGQIHMSGNIKAEHDRRLFSETGLSELPANLREMMRSYKSVFLSIANMKNGFIEVADKDFISEDQANILQRYAKVFEQAYTRFLDLQKAEAQTRESQIQLALERVRARTMAMQHSDELADTSSVLFQQIKDLGFETWSCGFCTWKTNDLVEVWMGADSGGLLPPMLIPYKEEPTHRKVYEDSVSGTESHYKIWEGLALKEHYTFLKKIPSVKEAIDILEQSGLALPERQCYYVGFFEQGYLLLITKAPNDELKELSKRFAKVFEQTYTRFLDLQNAEAQSKESQIQLALERVRARAMAMRHSDELAETASLLFKQVQSLDFPLVSCGFNIWQKEDEVCNAYMSDEAGFIQPPFKIPLSESPVFIHFAESRQKEESFYTEEVNGEVLAAHYRYMLTLPVFAETANNFFKAGFTFPESQVNNVVNFSYGNLIFITYKPVPEAHDIFKRFAKVFEQTYTRFLDLQKAEAQAREAQIEASLERVRSRSMGMQKSEELKEVIQIVYQQLTHLNIHLDHAGFVVDYIPKSDWHFWIADEQDIPAEITHPYFESVWATQFNEAKEKGTNFFVTHLNFEEKNKFYNELLSYVPGLPEASKDFYLSRPGLAATTVLFDNVSLYIENFEGIPYSDEDNKTLMRFGKVFQQTYTRFNDLKQAEVQAREAKIEAALESVRSASLAMHHSNQLKTVAAVMFKKLMELGLTLSGAFIFLFDKKTRDIQLWIATTTLSEPSEINIPYSVTIAKNQIFKDEWSVFETGEEIFNRKYSGKTKNDFFRYVGAYNYYQQEVKDFHLKAKSWIISIAGEKHCAVGFDSWEGRFALPEDYKILKRFARAFEQAYTRFLDLQKAEAQSRESQIELSLERVRAKTMAMHNSADVGETAAVMVDELKKLSIETIRCGIGIMHEPEDMEVWTISTNENNKTDIIIGWLDMNMHPLLHGAFESWRKKNESYYYDLKDDELLSYYNAINNYPGYPIRYDTSSLPGQIHHNEFYFPEGILFAFSLEQLTEEQRKIFKRFAGVFGQTYRRYLDLKRAEAQTKEAQIETALERVRSRTLAMQKSNELAETSAVLFKQLISLGIKPNRLYISIIKDEEGETEFWITDEDGSKVSMAYEDNLNNNSSFKKMFDGWKRQKKSLVIDMKGKTLTNYFNYLSSIDVPFKGGLRQKRRLQYIAYFNKGFIGMASPDEQPEETVFLLERFAAVFNLTFTRFNDLKIAEAHALQAEEDLIKLQTEKRRAEDALTELKETQKQLVQSEKMASLGELTAGIAHEIQNPLNFVNNFSEVSNELIDEMNDEIVKGNYEEVKAIAGDVKQNLEKINHHGKRADAIVKGMLQHSRTNSATKEPTDINKLADEYLRLAFHGLRAKDNFFNATLKTDFDESIGNLNIIPQDMGRAILNLITNAFYAVNEKKNNSDSKKYKPTITVSTKAFNSFPGDHPADRQSSGVILTVTDNGNGIPQNIVDKIFQPFFTTKPTGQGTGLGLSLSYDIIKAHGGEIKVKTKEGEGTEFIIQLPKE